MVKDLSGLISAIANLLWPIITIAAVFVLLPEIRQILMRVRSAQSFNLKWGDKEITVQEGFDNLEKVVRDIITEMQDGNSTGVETAAPKSFVLDEMKRASFEDKGDLGNSNRILWVDDKPQNNVIESQQLRTVGWETDQVLSTSEALSTYDASRYALVITDMYRREDGKVNTDAGIDLLRALKEINSGVRVICYCGSRVEERLRIQFLKSGGEFITSSTLELLRSIGKPLR